MKHRKARIGIRKAVLFSAVLSIYMNVHASFNNSEAGARPSAMAGAFCAIANDVNAVGVNPAGLVHVAAPELSAVYGQMYAGLSDGSRLGQGNFSFAMPVRQYLRGHIGAAWDETRLSDAYAETIFTVAYATQVYQYMNAGIAVKYLRKGYSSDIYTEADPVFSGNGYSVSGISADIGGLYRLNRKLSFGAVIKDINQPDMGLASKDIVPMTVRAGAAYWLKNGVMDADISYRAGSYDLALGAERPLSDRFLLRLGFLAGNRSRRNINLGFGSRFGNFNLDYAFMLPISGISGTVGTHRLAFTFRFGPGTGVYPGLSDEEAVVISNKLMEQERQIKALEERIKAQSEAAINSPAPSRPADAQEQAVKDLKEELERSRREAEVLRNRLAPAVNVVRPAEKKAAPPAVKSGTYIVKEGDTLESISRSIYGDAAKWQLIYKANSAAVGRGGEVRKGQILIIP